MWCCCEMLAVGVFYFFSFISKLLYIFYLSFSFRVVQLWQFNGKVGDSTDEWFKAWAKLVGCSTIFQEIELNSGRSLFQLL